MIPTRARRLLAAVAGAALVLAACGGESEEERVVQALADGLIADPAFEDYEITEEEATCVAQDAVDELGVDRMQEIGFTDDEEATDVDFAGLPESEVRVLAGAMEDCIASIGDFVVDALASGILEEQDDTFPVTDDEATCVATAVVDDISLTRLIVLGVQGEESGTDGLEGLEPDEVATFTDAFTGCIDVRQLLLDSIGASGDVPDETLACLDDNIDDDDIDALFALGFTGSTDAGAAEELLLPAIQACV